MPWGLKRFHQSRQLHFLTFSCYGRKPKLNTPFRRVQFEEALEHVRQQYRFFVFGYVVMPEHVHLLVSETEDVPLSRAMQSLKQSVSRRLALRAREPFWQERYYDFNVWSTRKLIEKLRYIHRNPVVRELVERPEDWAWSSFNHYATGVMGTVEIESHWTVTRRERAGAVPTVRMFPATQRPRPSGARTGHPEE